MSFYGSVIDAMSAAMAAANPARIHRRDLKDFADLPASEIAAGVFTMLAGGVSEAGPNAEFLDVLLVGQIELVDNSLPSAVEEAEFMMMSEIREFIARIGGVQVVHTGIRQSAQVDAPFGFVSASLRVGAFNIEPAPSMAIIPHIIYRAPALDVTTPITDLRIGLVPDVGAGHEPDYVKL